MSLEMITSFMGPNGTVPSSAFTVVKKPNDDVEIVTTTEDQAVAASVEHINDLIRLHGRVSREGMSRAAVVELQRIAPSAVPGGYGLEAFTELPSNVMLREGTEGIVNTVLTGLYKLIKFLIEKLKAGFNYLVDAYRSLTGIAPSAYKLAKQQVFTEEITKNWRTLMQSDLDEDVLKYLQEGGNDEINAQLIIDGFFNDANMICENLAVFEPLIIQLQRAVEDLVSESAINQVTYNRLWEASQAKTPTPEEYREMALRISRLLDTNAFQKITKLMEQLAAKVTSSKLYSDDKEKKPIVDRLRSGKLRDILQGLEQACTTRSPITLQATDVFTLAKKQDFNKLVNQLKSFEPVDGNKARDFKKHLDALRVYDRYVAADMTEENGFEVISTKFLSQQADVKAIMEVVRKITANYAETVFKIAACRDRVRLLTVPKIVASSPVEVMMENNEARMDELRKKVRAWIQRATTV